MRRKLFLRHASVLAALLLTPCGVAQAGAEPTPEQQLIDAIDKMRDGDADGARLTLDNLTRRQPNFRLAHLVYGELLAALSGARGATLIANQDDPLLRDLTEEARLRLDSGKTLPPAGYVPDSILQLSPQHPYFIVVDLPRARLYLLQNGRSGEVKVLRHHYAGMGRNGYGKQVTGDLRTPVGVYHVNDWISKDKLPELYGAGAFPLNYPNLWDQFKKRNGHGIWLHGVPADTYVRAPHSSEGCVTMANEDLLALKPYVTSGETPVILSDGLSWLPAEKLAAERDAFLARIEDWRGKWSARDTAGYLAFYGRDFTTDGMNLAAFTAHKRRVNAGKKLIDVRLRDLNLFRYPGAGEPMMLAEFTLDYRSDNYSAVSRKQQFWRRDKSGEWKIFREENR